MAETPPARSFTASKPQRAKIFPFRTVKPSLTASYLSTRRACAPLPASCSWENTLSPQPLSPRLIRLCLTPTPLLSFSRSAGISPHFKHAGPDPGQNTTPVASLTPASPGAESAGSDFLGFTALCGFAPPFPARSWGKQQPRPVSQLCRKQRASHRVVRAASKQALLLCFDSIWERKHSKNTKREILPSYLCNTHVPGSVLPIPAVKMLCISKTLLPMGQNRGAAAQIQPPVTRQH